MSVWLSKQKRTADLTDRKSYIRMSSDRDSLIQSNYEISISL